MITVVTAVELPTDHPMRAWALPNGFPMLVDAASQQLIEPALHYLAAKHLDHKGKRKWNAKAANTTAAEAYDLRCWFDFLQNVETGPNTFGKAWDLANENDYVEYRDQLHDLISNVTHRPLQDSTIRRRQITVEAFYKFAIGRGIYFGDFLKTKVRKGRTRPANSDVLRHTHNGQQDDSYVSAYREEVGPSGVIRALTEIEWQHVKRELGPMPSEARAGELTKSRDRLASELSCSTGLRVDEVSKLTPNDVFNLDSHWRRLSQDGRDSGYIPLVVTKTKRLKPRTILVPAYLVPELIAYVEGERKAAVNAGRAYAKTKGLVFREPKTLFVNHNNAGHNAGKAIRPQTLSYAFSSACRAAGLLTRVENLDPETMQSYNQMVSSHSFHDLRHTFAVWKYFALIAEKDAEPWKEIQILLGHAQLSTTTDLYLHVCAIEKARIGKKVMQATRKLGGVHNA
ncbi:tyrosine-type recombinase/integrase [Massilia consociata]|uniref:Tyrosine-type recombinase/integrase n=3 Tax=Massilia TaxID=149698 RepID=A0ABV6FMC1_9BURK